MEQAIPDGYCKRADGSLVPESLVKPIDRLRDQTIANIVAAAKKLSAQIAAFKGQSFSDIETFIAMSLEQYQVRVGGGKGNVTLVSFDGRFKVVRQVQERLVFDERLQAAKALIDACITSWSEGSRDEIKVLVNDAFRVDQEGQINAGRVLGLRRLAIADEKWQRAMVAIADSVRVLDSKPYIRVYERDSQTDAYRPVVLDVAAV